MSFYERRKTTHNNYKAQTHLLVCDFGMYLYSIVFGLNIISIVTTPIHLHRMLKETFQQVDS